MLLLIFVSLIQCGEQAAQADIDSTPDLNTVFQYNMPLRALARMTNGMVSMGMVDGLVWELKGFWLVGILRVIYEFVKNLILNSQMENRLKNS